MLVARKSVSRVSSNQVFWTAYRRVSNNKKYDNYDLVQSQRSMVDRDQEQEEEEEGIAISTVKGFLLDICMWL